MKLQYRVRYRNKSFKLEKIVVPLQWKKNDFEWLGRSVFIFKSYH